MAVFAAGIAAVVALAVGPPPGAPASGDGLPPPNVVVILADDLDLELGGFASMRQVQRLLVQRGTRFDRYYVPTSLCCPSRASLLLGRYAHTHGVLDVSPPTGGFVRAQELGIEADTLATALQEVGYRTALIGKYFNGYPRGAAETYVPPGWDAWSAPLWLSSYSQLDYQLNDDGVLASYGHAAKDYLGDQLAARAEAFLRESAASGQPFFLLLAPISPHQPATPAPRHANAYRKVRAPRTPSFDEADVTDKPQHVATLPRLSRDEVAAIDALYRRRLQSLLALDETVARLVARLAASGVLDRTFVVFSSDNGFHLGQHRLRPAKASAYEEDVHVPLVVRGPGVPAGRRLSHLASVVDLAPTIAEIAGAELSLPVEGRSLLAPLRQGGPPAAAFRSMLLLERLTGGVTTAAAKAAAFERFSLRSWLAPPFAALPLEDKAAPAPAFAALRTATHKYVEHATGERELYDLVADPAELRNLAATAAPSSLVAWEQALLRLRHCSGAECLAADAAAVPATPVGSR